MELTDDDVITVNGRRVQCQLDGFAIGCSQAFSMLGNSAEIDFANTSRWLLGQLGISARPVYTYTDISPPVDMGAFTVQTVEQRFEGWEYYFGGISWEPQVQTPQVQPQDTVPITVRYMGKKYVKDFLKALREAEKLLQKGDYAKLFGKSAADLVNMLENTEYHVLTLASGGPKYDPDTGTVSVTGAQTNSPTSVFINDKGPFFNRRLFVPGKGITTLDFGSNLRGGTVRCVAFAS